MVVHSPFILTLTLCCLFIFKLDGVGPVDNRLAPPLRPKKEKKKIRRKITHNLQHVTYCGGEHGLKISDP